MSKRTSDSKVKVPLSALAARRLRQQQQASIEAETSPLDTTSTNISPVSNPPIQPSIVSENVLKINGKIFKPTATSISAPLAADVLTTSTSLGAESEVPVPCQVSNFTQTGENFIYNVEAAEITVKLRSGESLAIQGEFRISVISGTVLIGGAILDPSNSLDVIAPSTQSIPIIESTTRSKKRKLENGPDSSGEYDAVFTLQNIRSGFSDVGRICPRFDRVWKPPLTSTTIDSKGSDSFTPILTSIQSNTTLAIPQSWQSAATSLSSTKSGPKVIFIVGGKSVGKSTFGRYLLNTITSQSQSRTISYLDLDPGQPSFTPPCMLSLHKITTPIVEPAFASQASTEILRQHHIGYTSPRDDPKHYLRCAADLVRCYRGIVRQDETTSLVVNTCGWVKGMGLELLRDLITICEPSDVVGLGDAEGVFTDILPEGVKYKKYLLESGSGGGGNTAAGIPGQQFTPADLRALQTFAYFHCLPEDSESARGERVNFGEHLVLARPIKASYKGRNRAIDAITVLDADISPELLITAINATIVAVNLIKRGDKDHPINRYLEDVHEESHDNVTPFVSASQFEGTSSLLPPEGTITVGLAIIRGVDEDSGELQLLTPITEKMFNKWAEEGYRILLCRGRDELPVWLMWDWREGRGQRRGTGGVGVKRPYLDFVVGGEVTGKGAKEWKVRRNIMRKSQRRR